MDNTTVKGWIVLARTAAARLAGIPRHGRQAVITRLAAETGHNTTSIRRALAAYDFILTEGPIFGVAPDSVAAPLSSIEALRRIGRLSPDHAGIYTRQVLRGELGLPSLLRLCSTLELQAREEAGERNEAFDRGMVSKLIMNKLADIAHFIEVAQRSPMAVALRADLEFAAPPGAGLRNIVAILSPGWKPSASRMTIEEACASLLAGSLSFSRVFYVPVCAADWQDMLQLLKQTSVDLDQVRPVLLDGPAAPAKLEVQTRPSARTKRQKMPEHT